MESKRIVTQITTIVLLFGILLTACSKEKDMRRVGNDGVQTNRRFELLLEAIQKKDSVALKRMFSKQAINESDNLDIGIAYLFELSIGKDVTWERGAHAVYEDIDYGDKKKEIKVRYYVNAKEQNYIVHMLLYPEWTGKPENEGLYSLRVVKEEDKDTQLGTWQSMKIPGIYVP